MLDSLIRNDIRNAIRSLQAAQQWPAFEIGQIRVDLPDEEAHGDYASNIAMQLTGVLRRSPLEIANSIKEHLSGEYAQVQIVHPGFMNFHCTDAQMGCAAQEALDAGVQYGASTAGAGEKILVEYISANPTGPLTLPNGRGGYLGDVLSNVLESQGFRVVREYYINDRGNQIDVLGESVARRFLQKSGINVPYPDHLYQGEYIDDLADKLDLRNYKMTDLKKVKWIKDRIKDKALKLMLKQIEDVTADKMKIRYDSWFSEKELYRSGLVEVAVEEMRQKGYIYEQDGAVWMRTTAFGDDKDRVLVKSSGEGAYIQGDVALFYERAFIRKFGKIILIVGADHHGYEKRLKAIPKMLGSEAVFDIVFLQLATLLRGGKEVRMSKRAGTYVTIDELVDEVGNDAARFFFLMYSADKHMQFDLDLALEQSQQNPVYYVQYAHARIASVLREVENAGGIPDFQGVAVGHEAERALVKQIGRLPSLLEAVSQNYEVHHLPTYAMDLARAFHHFYDHCRIIDEGEVNASRVALTQATKQALARTLSLLGVSTPEQM